MSGIKILSRPDTTTLKSFTSVQLFLASRLQLDQPPNRCPNFAEEVSTQTKPPGNRFISSTNTIVYGDKHTHEYPLSRPPTPILHLDAPQRLFRPQLSVTKRLHDEHNLFGISSDGQQLTYLSFNATDASRRLLTPGILPTAADVSMRSAIDYTDNIRGQGHFPPFKQGQSPDLPPT